jgi:hypothetical protein
MTDVWSPVTLPPEIYADLDLMLLTATSEDQRWQAIVAGTAEVVARFDHLAEPRISGGPTGGADVIRGFGESRERFLACGAYLLAGVVSEAIGVLTANQALHARCLNRLRDRLCAGHQRAVSAIESAAFSLRSAAEYTRMKRFRPFPPYSTAQPDYDIWRAAVTPTGAENHRFPLRKQLDGAGGAAGAPEFNPYVAGLYELELATHRRMYRFAYDLAVHVGIDVREDEKIWKPPDQVDREPV